MAYIERLKVFNVSYDATRQHAMKNGQQTCIEFIDLINSYIIRYIYL